MNSSTGIPLSTWMFLNATSDICVAGACPPACANAARAEGDKANATLASQAMVTAPTARIGRLDQNFIYVPLLLSAWARRSTLGPRLYKPPLSKVKPVASERVADERQHVPAKENRRPEKNRTGCRKFRRKRRIIALANRPRLVVQDEIQNVEPAEHHEHDL